MISGELENDDCSCLAPDVYQAAWELEGVREWDKVSSEAKESGEKAHVGRVFETCVEKAVNCPDCSWLLYVSGVQHTKRSWHWLPQQKTESEDSLPRKNTAKTDLKRPKDELETIPGKSGQFEWGPFGGPVVDECLCEVNPFKNSMRSPARMEGTPRSPGLRPSSSLNRM